MNDPGAPLRRGATVLRRDGQHTGKVTRRRTSTPVGSTQSRDQGGEEVK
jgi:hypothetical protein